MKAASVPYVRPYVVNEGGISARDPTGVRSRAVGTSRWNALDKIGPGTVGHSVGLHLFDGMIYLASNAVRAPVPSHAHS